MPKYNNKPERMTQIGVVEAFMNQETASAGIALTTDGQSLFSYNTRIAEHIPQNGGACTIVYNYTYQGNAYQSPATSSHVGMVKQQVPKRNVVQVPTAKKVGLIT